jgi:hypothetical protein
MPLGLSVSVYYRPEPHISNTAATASASMGMPFCVRPKTWSRKLTRSKLHLRFSGWCGQPLSRRGQCGAGALLRHIGFQAAPGRNIVAARDPVVAIDLHQKPKGLKLHLQDASGPSRRSSFQRKLKPRRQDAHHRGRFFVESKFEQGRQTFRRIALATTRG